MSEPSPATKARLSGHCGPQPQRWFGNSRKSECFVGAGVGGGVSCKKHLYVGTPLFSSVGWTSQAWFAPNCGLFRHCIVFLHSTQRPLLQTFSPGQSPSSMHRTQCPAWSPSSMQWYSGSPGPTAGQSSLEHDIWPKYGVFWQTHGRLHSSPSFIQ